MLFFSFTWNNIITENLFDVFFLFSSSFSSCASIRIHFEWKLVAMNRETNTHNAFIYVAIEKMPLTLSDLLFSILLGTIPSRTNTLFGGAFCRCSSRCVCVLCRHLRILWLLRVRRIRRVHGYCRKLSTKLSRGYCLLAVNEKSNVDDGSRCERLKSATITRKTIIYVVYVAAAFRCHWLLRSDLPSFKCDAV